MSSVMQSITTCPLICLFCENLIYEPITLYCGHTYCEQCVKADEFSSISINCLRCSKDIQDQIQSPIVNAREKNYSKNHFVKQLIERTASLRVKRENILLCHQAQNEYKKNNYEKAIDIYSKILNEYDDDHIALYGRAKVYRALNQIDRALTDIERVIQVKPRWAKGYYYRSEILFEMKHFTPALLSSLQGLSIDPEDQIGKQIMARHLHAVLHDTDNRELALTNDMELDNLRPTNDDNRREMITSARVNKTEIISQVIETYFPNELNERWQLFEQENIQGATIPRSPTTNVIPTIFEIPIFVCVLSLPCCTCPLHVFEPRYRLMMRRTIETQSRTFGMCTYDPQAETFADYGTILYIRGLVYTRDGRSIVDTIGQRRFRVVDRGVRDEYCTAHVQLIQDDPIEQEDFDVDLYQLNRDSYNRVRAWFDQLDAYRRTLITRQLEGYPSCDDLTQNSTDGPAWAWIILNLLPIEPDLQYSALMSQSFRSRLQIINNTIDFLLDHQQPATMADES
ncbi:unnamed protein product [Rotaria magnacalcarata]|uniref:LON peptidase N-terminal domain and RING finger protein 1 n=1 Tax=Rotaria magnacalcarata TaxID=392030 RepID=A0A8S2ITX9_9BILA|nr:unnamed protein product [Rotaria magnacalcarata]CAF3869339.1 unnamed protein product [Rotaria magnacalcarata]